MNNSPINSPSLMCYLQWILRKHERPYVTLAKCHLSGSIQQSGLESIVSLAATAQSINSATVAAASFMSRPSVF